MGSPSNRGNFNLLEQRGDEPTNETVVGSLNRPASFGERVAPLEEPLNACRVVADIQRVEDRALRVQCHHRVTAGVGVET
jgi:hypothetical protein